MLQTVLTILLYLNINFALFAVDQKRVIEATFKIFGGLDCLSCRLMLLLNLFILGSHFGIVLMIQSVLGYKVAFMVIDIIKILHFPVYAILYILNRIERIIK